MERLDAILKLASSVLTKSAGLNFDLSTLRGWDSIDACLNRYGLRRGKSFGKDKWYLHRQNGELIENAYLNGSFTGTSIVRAEVPKPELPKIRFNKDMYSSPGAIYEKTERDD